MENSSSLYRVTRLTAPFASMPPQSEDWGVPMDLNVARITRANLLLVGTGPHVVKLVSLLVPDANPSVMIRRQDGQLLLPPVAARPSTVVVRDVDALTVDEQRMLLAWLDAVESRTQVVSTASAPVLPLVEAGAFNDALYYRLNTVYINLSE